VSIWIFRPPLRHIRHAVLSAALLLAAAASSLASDTYRIVHTYPHDRQAFTQGLIYTDGHLYESTGLEGHSSLRMEDLETGSILQFKDDPSNYFAEGLTQWGTTLIQLTWQNHIALVYDRATFRFLRAIPLSGDGWGLTQDGKSLILSDGTATLHFLNPATLHELRRITVKDRGVPITQLNELEFVHGQIYANIWHTDRIVRIAPATGRVLGFIDLAGLLPAPERSSPEAVLNGIAWDAEHDRLFVTGKLWPKLFEIEIISQESRAAKGTPKK
jgi:glutamine cyclotransferase